MRNRGERGESLYCTWSAFKMQPSLSLLDIGQPASVSIIFGGSRSAVAAGRDSTREMLFLDASITHFCPPLWSWFQFGSPLLFLQAICTTQAKIDPAPFPPWFRLNFLLLLFEWFHRQKLVCLHPPQSYINIIIFHSLSPWLPVLSECLKKSQ